VSAASVRVVDDDRLRQFGPRSVPAGLPSGSAVDYAPSAMDIVSPDDQRVTFVELFFDLVFVFCVTQVVTLLHGHVDARTAGGAVLVFWLVWWAWTQFTWALNAANTDHPWVQLATLLATAVAFLLAVNIPLALGDGAWWFAAPYIAVRVVGLVVYSWVAAGNSGQLQAVRTFGSLSLLGLAAVAAGAVVGGEALYWCWGLAILLDLAAAGIGGRHGGWNLHPDHFVERHGLIVIIALGETLIVAAAGLSGAGMSAAAIATGVLAVAVTCGFWWSYFRHARSAFEHALAATSTASRAAVARDTFSVMHFPMLCGIVAMAVATEVALAHPNDPLAVDMRVALGAGAVLFVCGTGLALWRATGRLPLARMVVVPLAALGVAIAGGTPWVAMTWLLAALVVVATVEQRHEART
jgi:low temperature requirement protein LtrA